MQGIKTFLWFDGQAEEAANFYVSIFKDGRIKTKVNNSDPAPGPKNKPLTVEFTINGIDFVGLNGGPMFKFNESVSFAIMCDDQEEVDYYWNKLLEGGTPSQCGWLKDKFGLSWQVTPTALPKLLSAGGEKSKRVMAAMMQMVKLDIPTLEAAAGD